jgi:hypothetical protein
MNTTTDMPATPDHENNILTADILRTKIREQDGGSIAQNWIFRSLLYLAREQTTDLKNYRRNMGKRENRNSPTYWIDWMSGGDLRSGVPDGDDNYSMAIEDMRHFESYNGDPLSGEHLQNACELLAPQPVDGDESSNWQGSDRDDIVLNYILKLASKQKNLQKV